MIKNWRTQGKSGGEEYCQEDLKRFHVFGDDVHLTRD